MNRKSPKRVFWVMVVLLVCSSIYVSFDVAIKLNSASHQSVADLVPLNPVDFHLPTTAKEVVEKRTDRTATFYLGDNKYAAVSGMNASQFSSSSFKKQSILGSVIKWIDNTLRTAIVLASSQGPNFPATGADDGSIGTSVWVNPGSITASDDVRSNITVGSGTIVDSSVKIVKGGVISGNNKATNAGLDVQVDTFRSYGSSSDLWGVSWLYSDINSSGFGIVFSVTGGGTVSHYIKATNFGFSIPSNATVDGILAAVEEQQNSSAVAMVDSARITVYYTIPANTAPTFTVDPSDNGSSVATPTIVGNNVAFTATATDAENDNYYLAICKTNAIVANNNSQPTCTGGSWVISTSIASGSQAPVFYFATNPDIGSNTWYAFVCDQNASSACSASSQGSGNNGSPFVVGAIPDSYWVGGTGNWSDATNHWASTSGGTPNVANLPVSTSNVYFDSNSGSGTVTVDVDATVANFNETSSNITVTPFSHTLTITGDSTINGILNGDCNVSCKTTLSGTAKTMYGSGTYGGVQISNNHTIDASATFYINGGGVTSGVTVTNNGTVSVGSVTGANGSWVQGTSAVLTWVGGNDFNVPLTATASGNVVAYEETGGVQAATYYDLKIGTITPALSQYVGTLLGNTTVTHVLTIGGGTGFGQLNGSNRILTLSGSGTPMVINSNGSFVADTSTVNYIGDGATSIKGITYYDLGVGNATTQTGGRTYTLGGNISASSVTVGPSLGSNTQTLDTASHNIALTGTGTIFNMQSKGAITAGTSAITITDTSSSSKTFAGGGKTYNDLSITAGGSGAVIFSGSNTFNDFTINPPKTVTFTAGTTQTFIGTFSAVGSSGNIITINSTASAAATLSKSSGIVNSDWLNLTFSTATGGATWYAGCNSVNGGNNSGWLWNCNPAPIITSISPSSKPVGYSNFTMTVTGTNFTSGSVIYIDSLALSTDTSAAGSGTLTASIASGSPQGTYNITVVNPSPGGGTSNAKPFIVTGGGPPPGTGSITVHKTANGNNGVFSFTTTGTGFSPFSITTINGSGTYTQSGLNTGTYSATETVPQGWTKNSDNCGNISVTSGQNTDCYVTNTFGNQNPVPHIDSISPSSKNKGYNTFTMTITGSNFISLSSVYIGAMPISTTYVSPTVLTAQITAGMPVGTYSISVVNPTPGGGTSNSKTFTVIDTTNLTCNPAPTISIIVPSSKNQGDPGFLLTVNGGNFIASSVIYFDNLAVPTNFISGTQITANIAQTPSPGTYDVTVVNPSICPSVSGDTDTKPISIAVSPDGNSVYTANYVGGTVQRFNTSDLSVVAQLTTGGNPRFVATSPDGNYVYYINSASQLLQKLNATSLNEVARASTGARPTGLGVSPDGSSVYVVNGDGALQKFSSASLTLTAQVALNAGAIPYQLAVSPNGNYLYVIYNITSQLEKFDANSLTSMGPAVFTGSDPVSVIVSPDSQYVYVASTGSSLVQKFNASSMSLALSSTIAGTPTFIGISPDGVYAYVSFQAINKIYKLNTSNFTQVANSGTFSDSYANTVSADGNFVYLANFSASKIQKFNASLQLDGGTSNAKVFTVNATQTGSLKIVKNATGGDRTFSFSVSGPSVLTPSITTTNGTGSSGPTAVNPGTYSIVEVVPSGWTFNSARCDNGYVFGVNGVTNVTVTAGQTTTCTFADTKNNITPNTFIKINKDAGGGDGTFSYSVGGPISFNASLTTAGGVGAAGSTPASPGTYSITESLPNGWTFEGGGCSNGSGNTGTATANGFIGVTVIAGQTTTCDFGNQKIALPTNTYLKIVANTSGGDATFNYTVAGPTNLTPSVATTNGTGVYGPTAVNSGTSYSIIETVPNGWTFDSVFCDKAFTAGQNGATGVTVIPGQTTTCTFSNTKNTVSPGTSLKIVKNAIGGNAVFNYSVAGPTNLTPSITAFGGIGSSGPTSVLAGSYSIEEVVPNGWTFTSVSCDHSYTGGSNGAPTATNVVVVDGETTTCTFTGTKDGVLPPQASLKIIKNTLNNSEGSFDYAISGPLTFNETVNVVDSIGSAGPTPVSVGTYSITEAASPDWTMESAMCDHAYVANSSGIASVEVVPNEVTTCIFTNTGLTNDPPVAKLKIVKNTSGGNSTFDYVVAGPTNLTRSITTTNGTGISGPTTVEAGVYDITEAVPNGWTFTSVFCDRSFTPSQNGATNVGVVDGHTTTCTFSNIKNTVGPHIISIIPDTKYAGDLPFTLTVNGTGFVPNSVVYFNGFALTTNYISSTKLTNFISPVPPVGVYNVTVVNPAPGGGTSNAVPFTVRPLDSAGSIYAGNLGVSDSACPITQATAISYFYWNYGNTKGSAEKKFELQISDQQDYSQPLVDRTFDNLSNAPGTQNQQTIEVKLASTNPTTPGCNFINFHKTYYWRVKVWETNENGGLGNSSEWIEGQPYTTIAHPGPYASFGFSPPIPAPESSVIFTNTSTCYNATGPVSCTSYTWAFGDNGTSGAQNPTHVYQWSGNFLATLQAYDDLGTYCQAQKTVPIFNNTSTNGLPFFKEISPF